MLTISIFLAIALHHAINCSRLSTHAGMLLDAACASFNADVHDLQVTARAGGGGGGWGGSSMATWLQQ